LPDLAGLRGLLALLLLHAHVALVLPVLDRFLMVRYVILVGHDWTPFSIAFNISGEFGRQASG
jgi:hypothetical protein